MSKCPYCEGEVSLTAKKCLHCGEWLREEEVAHGEVPPPPGCLLGKEILPPGYLTKVVWPKLKTPWTPFILVSLVILVILGSMIDADMKTHSGTSRTEREPLGLRTECQEMIKAQITNPRSAEFSGTFDTATRATMPEDGRWLLTLIDEQRGEIERLRMENTCECEKVEKLRDAINASLISLTAVAGHSMQPMMAADARDKIVIIKQALADTDTHALKR